MAAIELASTEGFTRSAADVSLRRLAYYSLSPVLKTAFEQIYGAPYLARMLFAEIGERAEDDLFLRVEYDGAIATSGGGFGDARQHFGVLSGTRASTELMESFLQREHEGVEMKSLKEAAAVATDAWVVGTMALTEDGARAIPAKEMLAEERDKHLADKRIEAAVLERKSESAIRYRSLADDEIKSLGIK
jgi:proteasome alpha subunit